MMDSEESCVYCSKYLFGLNDFNRKMHIETCKVRKLVESQANFNNNNNANAAGGANSNNSSSQNQSNGNTNANGGTATTAATTATTASSLDLNLNNQLEDYMILGENCSYCFKSFKDFKNDFNKRLHIKCCKIKKVCYFYYLTNIYLRRLTKIA
jgi:hypothetical protein